MELFCKFLLVSFCTLFSLTFLILFPFFLFIFYLHLLLFYLYFFVFFFSIGLYFISCCTFVSFVSVFFLYFHNPTNYLYIVQGPQLPPGAGW